MTYLCHTVYVVTVDYPTMGAPTSIASDVLRPAERRDLATEKLGVISDGRVLPLSPWEHGELLRRYAL